MAATPPPPQPVDPAATAPPALVFSAPSLLATGLAIELSGRGAGPRRRVQVQVKLDGRWRDLAGIRADARGRFSRPVRPETSRPGYRLRAVAADGRRSRSWSSARGR